MRWVDTNAFFVFHFANGFELSGEIAIDYVRHANLDLAERGRQGGDPPRLHRMRIDLATGAVRDGRVDGPEAEFPRGDDRHEARATRWVYLPTRTAALSGKSIRLTIRSNGERRKGTDNMVVSPAASTILRAPPPSMRTM
nr:carotenoid oxygenase family protein [Thiocapsa sp. KS1]